MASQSSKPLRSNNVAIVGAGIAGYAAAATLAQSGFSNITIIDSQKDPLAYEPNRAYSLVIDKKGQGLINRLTGFQEIFAKEAFCQSVRVYSEVTPDGKTHTSSSQPSDGPLYWLMKYRLLELFDKYVKERYPKVVFKMDTSVDKIIPPTEGSTKLVLRDSKGVTSEHEFDLILACDGSNSTIHKQAILLDTAIRSSHGMAMYSKSIGSTGIRTKGIVTDYRPLVSSNGGEKKFAESSTVYKFTGQRSKRPADSAFDVLLLPVSSGQDVKRRATLALPEGHKLLSITNGKDMMQLFRDNFPQLPVEEIFPMDELDIFAKTTASTFPPVQRPRSLVGYFEGSSFESGVAFLGDSAHTLPLDTAQGSNSALKDVETLLNIIENSSEDATLHGVLKSYEQKRDKEAWTLIKLAPSAAAYQYKQNMARYRRFMMNKSVRAGLASLIPLLCSPDLDTLMRKGITYQEARRRNRRCTASIFMLLTTLISAPISLALRKSDD